MANFRPFQRYILYCLDRLIDALDAKQPFLDVGCGAGDLSHHLATHRDWHGKAIDASEAAITRAHEILRGLKSVTLAQGMLETETGRYNTVVMLDVLEHIENDVAILRDISRCLNPGGLVFITVPSNPKEWRWDDAFYGHLRRYSREELQRKLLDAGLQPQAAIDVSYPVFWAMRRAYTRLFKRRPPSGSPWERTLASTTVNAWHVPVLGTILSSGEPLWRIAYHLQYKFFRHAVNAGGEMLVVARKS